MGRGGGGVLLRPVGWPSVVFRRQVSSLCTGRAGACVVHVPNSWLTAEGSLALLRKWPSGLLALKRAKAIVESWMWMWWMWALTWAWTTVTTRARPPLQSSQNGLWRTDKKSGCVYPANRKENSFFHCVCRGCQKTGMSSLQRNSVLGPHSALWKEFRKKLDIPNCLIIHPHHK